MGLFGGYEKAGAGIAKDAPKKKPFFRFWEIAFRKFWKLFEVNLLFMSAFIPLVAAALSLYFFFHVNQTLTMVLVAALVLVFAVIFGPVTAACTKILRNFTLEKPFFMMDVFIKTFRSCFKQACVMGLLDLMIVLSVSAGCYVYPKLIAASGDATIYYVMFVAGLSVAIAVLMMSFYAYLMIVSTDLSMKNILKNSFALSCIALKTNLITLGWLVLIFGVFALVTVMYPFIMAMVWPFMPAAFAGLIIVFNSYPVIQKYVINPYYEQRGEVNPEYLSTQTGGENVFEDQGGKEKPIEAPKKQKKTKGKVIS